MSRRIWVALAAGVALAVAGGIAANSQGARAKQTGDKDLVMFTMTSTNVYGANQIKGAQREAKRLGYNLKVYENMFSQPQQDQQVQQYLASGAKPAAVIFWPWIAAAGVNDVRLLSRLAPVIQLTQPPFPKAWPYVKAYAGAYQVLIGQVAGQMMLQARKVAKAKGLKFHSANGNLLVFQHPQGEFTGTARWQGFTQVVNKTGKPFKVLHTEYGANDPDPGYQLGSQIVPKYKSQGLAPSSTSRRTRSCPASTNIRRARYRRSSTRTSRRASTTTCLTSRPSARQVSAPRDSGDIPRIRSAPPDAVSTTRTTSGGATSAPPLVCHGHDGAPG
jgi:ABC-type sugar transport system substrate-binding protein